MAFLELKAVGVSITVVAMSVFSGLGAFVGSLAYKLSFGRAVEQERVRVARVKAQLDLIASEELRTRDTTCRRELTELRVNLIRQQITPTPAASIDTPPAVQ